MRLRYTQQSLYKVDFCRETSIVKLHRLALALAAFLSLLFMSALVFGWPDAQKQYDPRLFQELQWRLIGPSRGGGTLAGGRVGGGPGVFFFLGGGGGGWEKKDAGGAWGGTFCFAPHFFPLGNWGGSPASYTFSFRSR